MTRQEQCKKHFCNGRVKHPTEAAAAEERQRRGVCNRVIVQCEECGSFHVTLIPSPRPLRVDAPY